jgi:hypothetical protein
MELFDFLFSGLTELLLAAFWKHVLDPLTCFALEHPILLISIFLGVLIQLDNYMLTLRTYRLTEELRASHEAERQALFCLLEAGNQQFAVMKQCVDAIGRTNKTQQGFLNRMRQLPSPVAASTAAARSAAIRPSASH